MNFIKTFEKLGKKDISTAGGKGASLGEMTKAKFSIPPGFVILSSAFDKFLEETDLGVEIEAATHKINHKDIESIEKSSEKIRDLIHDVKFPKHLGEEILKEFQKLKAKYVAVRSSATAEDSSIASWAGELESYLNITKNNLLKSIKKCWSSLFTPRAIFYRCEKNLHKQKISVAVVVQKMIQSDVSGICFTVHPVTKDKDQMVIEAGYGLGEAVVGGRITPDTYIVHKKRWKILDKNIGCRKIIKQKLPNAQILKLAKICRLIENHFKKPQDIEWAMKNNKFYILQSRPITTL